MVRYLRDIRTWIVLAFLIRLIGITEPPIEATHGWRQAFTNMVARNLAEGPFDLLHPRTSMAGERPDVVASEFPGFNAIVAMMQRVAGPAHWYGRLVALLIVSLGTWAFHHVVRREFGERTAFNAAFLLLWSSMFLYGRKSMPDAFAVGLLLMAIDAADRALRQRIGWWLAIAVLLTMLGGLCKIPVMVLAPVWVLFALRPGTDTRWRLITVTTFSIAAAPVIWWYFIWQPKLLAEFGNQLYYPVPVLQGIAELGAYGADTFQRFAFSAMIGYLPFAATLAGGYFAWREKDPRIPLLATCVTLPFLYFMSRAGSVFSLHGYYVLPMVPLMSLLGGITLSNLPQGRWHAIALLLCVVEGLGLRWSDLRPSPERAYLLRAEKLATRFSTATEPVATTGELDPRAMYFLHRHGWSLANDRLRDTTTLDSLSARGLRTVFVDRHRLSDPLPWSLVHEDADWRVYQRPAQVPR